jgi:hypothetical protein
MRTFLEKQARDSVYLFARGSERIKDFRAAWKTACKTAGLSGLLSTIYAAVPRGILDGQASRKALR